MVLVALLSPHLLQFRWLDGVTAGEFKYQNARRRRRAGGGVDEDHAIRGEVSDGVRAIRPDGIHPAVLVYSDGRAPRALAAEGCCDAVDDRLGDGVMHDVSSSDQFFALHEPVSVCVFGLVAKSAPGVGSAGVPGDECCRRETETARLEDVPDGILRYGWVVQSCTNVSPRHVVAEDQFGAFRGVVVPLIFRPERANRGGGVALHGRGPRCFVKKREGGRGHGVKSNGARVDVVSGLFLACSESCLDVCGLVSGVPDVGLYPHYTGDGVAPTNKVQEISEDICVDFLFKQRLELPALPALQEVEEAHTVSVYSEGGPRVGVADRQCEGNHFAAVASGGASHTKTPSAEEAVRESDHRYAGSDQLHTLVLYLASVRPGMNTGQGAEWR